jgi:hypothetical protein
MAEAASTVTALVRYDTMCSAIAAAYKVDEVKDIRDRAAALEHYSRQAHNVEAERQCCEIRLRAERKAGQLLAQIDKLKGRPGKASDVTRLSDLGISHDQSSQWQRLAAVPQPEFEAALAGPEKPTTNGIIHAAFREADFRTYNPERDATPAKQPRRAKTMAAQKAPRSRYAIDPAAIAAGKLPDTAPVVTSKANPHYQKHFDRLFALAKASDWDAVRDYEVKGSNSYSKMVARYRLDLLAVHAASETAQ